MENFRWWAFWRRMIYGTGFTSFWALVGVLVYYTSFYQPPTCFDGILNGTEVEVDAGGTCVRVPSSQVMKPNIVWAEVFEVTPGQYNAVAYVENRNQTIGTPDLPYTFSFLSDGVEVARRSGTAELPPNSVYPLFEGRVFTDDQKVTDVELILGQATDWRPATSIVNQLRTSDLNLRNVDTRPRLEAKLENTSLDTIGDIEVVATIFNDQGTAVAASQTFIDSFFARSSQDIIFTWPNTIAKTVRSCSIPTSVMLGIDLSGSMNNDQDAPPQPITDALAAASTFIDGLQEADKVGVVTFATEGDLVQTLTDAHSSVSELVRNLEIDPSEEAGQTNTAAAFTLATAELSSERHSTEARRAFVLLTDGLPTAGGTEEATTAAQTAAQALVNSGADVYVIGLGANVNTEFIRSIASSPGQAYLAPSRADLGRIYASITDSLCEVGPTKIEVLAKPPVNFAPLR